MVVHVKVAKRPGTGYVLVSRSAEVGWLQLGRLGFGGFRDLDTARRAAAVAVEVLRDWYRTRWRTGAMMPWPEPVERALQITEQASVVGRLLNESMTLGSMAELPGFELRVPSEMWVATGVELAQRIWSALHEAGVVSDPDATLTTVG